MKRIAIAPLLVALMASGPAAADLGVGVTGGTLGVGVELSYPLSQRFHVRGVVAGFDISSDFETDNDDLDYNGDAELRHGAALLDFHPVGGSFRLTGGVVVNNNEITGEASCDQTACTLGNSPGLLVRGDRADADIDFNSVSPYLGIGWGTGSRRESGFALTADIGVYYLGTPEADLTLSGPSTANPIAQNEIEEEEADIQDDVDVLRVYPVLMIGASYRF